MRNVKHKLVFNMGLKPCALAPASAAQCSTEALLRMLRYGGSQSCEQLITQPDHKKRKQTMKKILIIYTGGTIGMVRTPDGYAPKSGYFRSALDAIPSLHSPEMPEWELYETA